MTIENFHPNFVTVRQEGEALVVGFRLARLSDDYNIEQLGQELFALVGHFGHRRLVIDLSRVDHVSSSVLGKFITLHRRLHRAGGMVVFCGAEEEVGRILENSRLIEYFHVAPDVEAAIGRLGQAAA